MGELNMSKVNNEKVTAEIVESQRDTNPDTKTVVRGKLQIDGERSLHHFSIVRTENGYSPYFLSFPFKRTYENDAGYTNTVYDSTLVVPDNYDGGSTTSSTIWKAIDSALLASFMDAALGHGAKATLKEEFNQFRRRKFKERDHYSPGCNNCFFKESHRPTSQNERGLTEDRTTRHYCALWQRYVDKDVQEYFDELEKTQHEKQPLSPNDGLNIKGRRVKNLIDDMLNAEGRGCRQHAFKFQNGNSWVVKKPYPTPLMEVMEEFEGIVNLGSNVVLDATNMYKWVEDKKGTSARAKTPKSDENNASKEENADMTGNSSKKGGSHGAKDKNIPAFTPKMIEKRDELSEKQAKKLARALGIGKGLKDEGLEEWVEEYVQLAI